MRAACCAGRTHCVHERRLPCGLHASGCAEAAYTSGMCWWHHLAAWLPAVRPLYVQRACITLWTCACLHCCVASYLAIRMMMRPRSALHSSTKGSRQLPSAAPMASTRSTDAVRLRTKGQDGKGGTGRRCITMQAATPHVSWCLMLRPALLQPRRAVLLPHAMPAAAHNAHNAAAATHAGPWPAGRAHGWMHGWMRADAWMDGHPHGCMRPPSTLRSTLQCACKDAAMRHALRQAAMQRVCSDDEPPLCPAPQQAAAALRHAPSYVSAAPCPAPSPAQCSNPACRLPLA